MEEPNMLDSEISQKQPGSITGLMDVNLSRLWEMVRDREAWRAAACGVAELDMTERQQSAWLNWTLVSWKHD